MKNVSRNVDFQKIFPEQLNNSIYPFYCRHTCA